MSDPRDPTLKSNEPVVDQTESDGDEAYCAACNQSFTLDHIFCPNDGAKLVKLKARPDMLLGRVFDSRYEVRMGLGHGGMGTVYRGWQLSVDREVAIKVIHPKLATDRTVAKRFLREARLSSRLSQPNIVNVYDFGQTDDGILYLVMELLRGHTLGKELEAQKPLALRRIVTMAKQVCDALVAAHAQGIVHRDLKPGNIVVLDDPPGRDLLKILDFGLAKSLVSDTTSLVTHTDAILGTPLYMPPEQILGKPSDHRADLYSLGCILYQMAVGRPPFVGENINIVLAAHVQNPVPMLPLSVSPRLARTITQLMMKAPEDRPANASVVHEAISQLTDGSSTSVPDLGSSVAPMQHSEHPTPAAAVSMAISNDSVSRDLPRSSGRRWVLLLLALAAVAVIVIIVVKSQSGGGAPASRDASMAAGGEGDATAPADGAPADAGTAADALLVDARSRPDARAPIDARTPVDARAPADARIVRPRPDAPLVVPIDASLVPLRVDAGVPHPPVIDARQRPDIDLFKVDGGR